MFWVAQAIGAVKLIIADKYCADNESWCLAGLLRPHASQSATSIPTCYITLCYACSLSTSIAQVHAVIKSPRKVLPTGSRFFTMRNRTIRNRASEASVSLGKLLWGGFRRLQPVHPKRRLRRRRPMHRTEPGGSDHLAADRVPAPLPCWQFSAAHRLHAHGRRRAMNR